MRLKIIGPSCVGTVSGNFFQLQRDMRTITTLLDQRQSDGRDDSAALWTLLMMKVFPRQVDPAAFNPKLHPRAPPASPEGSH
jgi:hypothetical protein